jgi:hypothetical protein
MMLVMLIMREVGVIVVCDVVDVVRIDLAVYFAGVRLHERGWGRHAAR